MVFMTRRCGPPLDRAGTVESVPSATGHFRSVGGGGRRGSLITSWAVDAEQHRDGTVAEIAGDQVQTAILIQVYEGHMPGAFPRDHRGTGGRGQPSSAVAQEDHD